MLTTQVDAKTANAKPEITTGISANELKIIAIIAMIFDHFVAVFVMHDTMAGSLLRIPGRIVAPIMCYFIAEGFFYTSNIKKYAGRLFIFAALSHFPYVLYFGLSKWRATGVMWGLMLGLIALYIVKHEALRPGYKILGLVLCCIMAYPADWKFISVLWIVAFGVFRGSKKKQMLAFVAIGVLLHIIPTIITLGWAHAYEIAIILAIPLLMLYKGKRGKRSTILKWGFYAFYPLHLILLFVLRSIFSI